MLKKRRFLSAFTWIVFSFLTAAGGIKTACAEVEEWPELSENGIPVVYINIDEDADGYGTIEEMNSSEDHSVRCTGNVRIEVPAGYKGDYSDKPLESTGELKLDYIRGRGNTTWVFALNKKPYKFKLDKKADLLGMGENKHWILLSNENDETLLRNRLISYMGSAMGLEYTPKMLSVDVVMNGKYLGSYILSEQVRVGKNRVDIDELGADDNDEPEVTGGYLLAYHIAVDGKNPEENCFYTKNGAGFSFDTPVFYSEDPKDEPGTAEQRAYIENYLQMTEDAVKAGNVWDYMDEISTIDYWWIQEFSVNIDAYKTDSTYLYKKRDGKLYWGPLWDFDLSFGKTIDEKTGFNHSRMPWIDELRKNDPEYIKELVKRWKVFSGIIDDILKEGGVLDRYADEIRLSWENNRPLLNATYYEFDEKIEELREWLTERRDWINENLDLLDSIEVTVSFTAQGEEFLTKTLYTGYPLPDLPEAPDIEGYYFLNWECEGEELDPMGLPHIYKDTEIEAVYVKNEDVIHADNVFFQNDDVWVDIDEVSYYPQYLLTPDNAQEKNIVWSSSDQAVAEVDEYGSVEMKKTGDAVISAALSSGKTFSYAIHIYENGSVIFPDPEDIKLVETEIRLRPGEYAQIKAVPEPFPCNTDIMFDHEEDNGCIELLEYGVVRAVAPGETTVRVIAPRSYDPGKEDTEEEDLPLTAECRIIVTEEDEGYDTGDDGKAWMLLLILAISSGCLMTFDRGRHR